MDFKSTQVTKTEDNFHFIEWEMEPASGESVDDWEFQIYWSNDPVSIFNPVEDESENVVVIDGAVGPLSHKHDRRHYDFNKDYYYKVLAIEKSNPMNSFFGNTVFICMSFDGVHDVIRYNETVLYDCYHGEPCKIIKKKNFGTRCSKCWSFERRQRTMTHCDQCKGTGFEEGYYDAIEMQISFDSDPKKSDSQKEWENVQDTKRARLSNYPLVKPKDLIINLDKAKRYVISHVETTKLPNLSYLDETTETVQMSKSNYILSQILTLEELNPDDNEYFLDEDYYKLHPPITTADPLSVSANQKVVLNFDDSDFQISDGVFELKNTIENMALNKMITSEDIATQYTVVAVNSEGELIIADSSDTSQIDSVVGIAITTGLDGEEIVVQKVGRISNNLWNWTVGIGIFFDDNGMLTQTNPSTGFSMNVAKPVSPTEIEVLLRLPIRRQGTP